MITGGISLFYRVDASNLRRRFHSTGYIRPCVRKTNRIVGTGQEDDRTLTATKKLNALHRNFDAQPV